MNKIETFTDKIKSVKDIKKELIAFFSINGYSEAVGTNSLFKKAFSLITFIVLFAFCMVLVARNVNGFQANDVVSDHIIRFELSDHWSLSSKSYMTKI